MATAPRTPPLTLNPPAGGTCASCFYGQTFARISGSTSTRLCRRKPAEITPAPNVTVSWPIVADTDWCGEGADLTTMVPFKPVWA